MALPNAAPGGGDRSAPAHHRYVPTQPGQKWHAYSAGPAQWFLCHTKGRSKPCLHAMTGGELDCDRCAQITPPQVIGYVPLYREIDSRPVLVIVAEFDRDKVDKLKLHQRVLVGRESQKSDGVFVVAALDPRPVFVTALKQRMVPVDITHCLLKLWNLPILTQWYMLTHGAGEKVEPVRQKVSAADVQEPGEGRVLLPHDRLAGLFDAQAEKLDAAAEAARRNAEWVAAQKPSANGKHKKGGGT